MSGPINEKQVSHANDKQVDSAPLSISGSQDRQTKDTHHVVANEKDLDKAYLYMKGHEGEGADDVDVDLVKLRRKIDWRIVPIMLAAYTMQFVDKVMINVSTTKERKIEATRTNERLSMLPSWVSPKTSNSSATTSPTSPPPSSSPTSSLKFPTVSSAPGEPPRQRALVPSLKLTFPRLLPPKSSRRKMARHKHNPLGHSHSLHRRRNQLRHPANSPHLPGHLRSSHRPLPHAH